MKKVNIEAPGLRIIKTVIAVLIVMLIGTFSNGILQPYEMTIVAVLAIQADVAKTFKEVKNRISATVVGGIIGTIAMAISFINSSQIVNIILRIQKINDFLKQNKDNKNIEKILEEMEKIIDNERRKI